MSYIDKLIRLQEDELRRIDAERTAYTPGSTDSNPIWDYEQMTGRANDELNALRAYQEAAAAAGITPNSTWNEAVGAGVLSPNSSSFGYNRNKFGGYGVNELLGVLKQYGVSDEASLRDRSLRDLDAVADYLTDVRNYEAMLADGGSDFFGLDQQHFLGEGLANLGEKIGLSNEASDLFGSSMDPMWRFTKKNVDPVMFGEQGKDNPITGEEGEGLVENKFIGPIATMFAPYWTMAANAMNRQVDYENNPNRNIAGWDRSVVEPTVVDAGMNYVMGNVNNANMFGTSAGGKALSRGVTGAIGTKIQGGSDEAAGRAFGIGAGSSYAGSAAGDYFGENGVPNQSAERFANVGTSMLLNDLWDNPDKFDLTQYYAGLMDQATKASNQQRNSSATLPSSDVVSDLQNTPAGSNLLALFNKDKEESTEGSEAGGSGQYGGTNDQTQRIYGREGYLA